jgi:hypothetical protein
LEGDWKLRKEGEENGTEMEKEEGEGWGKRKVVKWGGSDWVVGGRGRNWRECELN